PKGHRRRREDFRVGPRPAGLARRLDGVGVWLRGRLARRGHGDGLATGAGDRGPGRVLRDPKDVAAAAGEFVLHRCILEEVPGSRWEPRNRWPARAAVGRGASRLARWPGPMSRTAPCYLR